MHKKLMQWLCCPLCKSDLNLDKFEFTHGEVLEGALICGSCDCSYPVIAGVPRMLTGEMQEDFRHQYPDFFDLYDSRLKTGKAELTDQALHKKRQTQSRFGYEWIQFDDYACDNFSEFIKPLSEGFFSGKLGLDVGCGAGRHIKGASQLGAEVIGVDLSQAVDAAYQNNVTSNNVHIVQADAYHLPFKSETFDFIYSLGVLHHMPAPEKAYHQLPTYLKSKGSLFVWLYAYMPRKVLLELLRIVSQKLSNKNIHRMAWLCNMVDYGIVINSYKLLSKLPLIGRIVDRFAPLRVIEYAGHGYQISLTDWYDRLSAPITNYYRQEKMQEWLDNSPLNNQQLQAVGDSWWWLYGEAD